MSDVFKRVFRNEIAGYRNEELETKTKLEVIRNLMETQQWTAEDAMEAMEIPAEERGVYSSMLSG